MDSISGCLNEIMMYVNYLGLSENFDKDLVDSGLLDESKFQWKFDQTRSNYKAAIIQLMLIAAHLVLHQ